MKPCPFCGSEDCVIMDNEQSGGYQVLCWCCHARGPDAHDEKVAARQWNDRKGGANG